MNRMNRMNSYIIIVAIALMLVMFNFYFVSVITGQSNKPEYPMRTFCDAKPLDPSMGSIDSACEENPNYASTIATIESYDFKRSIGLLVMGIISVLLYFLLPVPNVKEAFGISGIITLFYSAISNWTKYSDVVKLIIISAGLIIIILMASTQMLPSLMGSSSSPKGVDSVDADE